MYGYGDEYRTQRQEQDPEDQQAYGDPDEPGNGGAYIGLDRHRPRSVRVHRHQIPLPWTWGPRERLRPRSAGLGHPYVLIGRWSRRGSAGNRSTLTGVAVAEGAASHPLQV